MKMQKRLLGQSGVEFSPLTLGTVKFGRNQSVKYPGSFELPLDKDIQTLLAIAQEYGLTSLDTAPAYGLSEQRLGQLLKGNRENWQIISKAGESFDCSSNSSHYNYQAKALRQSLEQSLRLLNTDYLDCWMLHSNGDDITNLNDEVIKVLTKAKQQGWVRSIGMSTKTVNGGLHALKYLDAIMMTVSLQHTEHVELFDAAEKQGKGILLKKIYDSGWALNIAPYKVDGNDKKSANTLDKMIIMQDTLKNIFRHKSCSSAVIGTINPKHLVENIQAFSAISANL